MTPLQPVSSSLPGWLLVTGWLLLVPVTLYLPDWSKFASSAQFLLLIGVACTVGLVRCGMKSLVILLVIALVMSNVLENLSIATGFPFGFFHHTDALGPKLFAVPLLVGFTYFAVAVLSWIWSDLILGSDPHPRARWMIVARPALSMFVASAWDACIDPIGATLSRDWIYPLGGGYFGVPLSNSLGWMLNILLILLLFEGWRSYRPSAKDLRLPTRGWQLLTPVFIGLYLTPAALSFLTFPDRTVTDPAGISWHSRHLFESATLVGVHTLALFAVLGIITVLRGHTRPA